MLIPYYIYCFFATIAEAMSNRPMYKREDPTAAFLDYFGLQHMAPLPDDVVQI